MTPHWVLYLNWTIPEKNQRGEGEGGEDMGFPGGIEENVQIPGVS